MAIDTREQRRNRRAAVAIPVACRDTGLDTVFVTTTDDLSASGASIRAPYRAPRHAVLFLVIGHDRVGISFRTKARVVRTRRTSSGFVWGVKFAGLSLEEAAMIGRFVVCRQARPSLRGGSPVYAEQIRSAADDEPDEDEDEAPHPAELEWDG